MIETKINIQALRQRTAGDKELIVDLIELIKTEQQFYLSDAEAAISKSDFKALSSVMHKFKSAVAVFGFDNLVEEILNVEKNAIKKVEDFDFSNKINSIFISLNKHLTELENYLKK